MDVKVLFSPGW
jgi:hypothetical protein